MAEPRTLSRWAAVALDGLRVGGVPVDADACYLVGGAVRDALVERPPRDWDVALAPDPEAFRVPPVGRPNRWGGRKVIDPTAQAGGLRRQLRKPIHDQP